MSVGSTAHGYIFHSKKVRIFPGLFGKRIYLGWICGNDYYSNIF